jgi:hypothetical protein
MAVDYKRSAGTLIYIDGLPVAKVNSFTRTRDVSEEDVTGFEDVQGVAPEQINVLQFIAVAVGETAAMSGISLEGDDGQNALSDAADTGQIVELRQETQAGSGFVFTGFLTSFEETGEIPGTYTWSANFRINSKEKIGS